MMPTLYFKVDVISFIVEAEKYGEFSRIMSSAAGILPLSIYSYEISIRKEGQEPVKFLPESFLFITFSEEQPYISLNNKLFYRLEDNSAESPHLIHLSHFSISSLLLSIYLMTFFCFRRSNYATSYANQKCCYRKFLS